MIKLILIFISIGLILSIDAFVLCLGLTNKPQKQIYLLPIFIGVSHIILPLLGFYGFKSISINNSTGRYLSSAIFFGLALNSSFVSKQNDKQIIITILSLIVLSIGVSIDSFLVGISILYTNSHIFLASLTFGIISFIISIIALSLKRVIINKISINFDFCSSLLFIIFGLLILLEII